MERVDYLKNILRAIFAASAYSESTCCLFSYSILIMHTLPIFTCEAQEHENLDHASHPDTYRHAIACQQIACFVRLDAPVAS
jgi:hypothetical protein